MADTSQLALQTLELVKDEARRNDSLPGLGQCVEVIKHLGRDSSAVAIHDIAGVILKDLTLTTRVLQVANSIEYNRSGQRVSTVTQAILVLGLAPIRSIAYTILLLERMPNHHQAERIRIACLLSVISGTLSRKMAERLRHDDPEHGFITAACSHLGSLLFYSCLPDQVREVSRLEREEHFSREEAGLKILGLRIEQLGRQVGESLGLPGNITSYMDPFHIRDRELASLDKTILQIIRVTHRICDIIERSRSSDEIEEAMEDLREAKDPFFRDVQFTLLAREAIHEIDTFYHHDTRNAFWSKTVEFAAKGQKKLTQKLEKKSEQANQPMLDIHLFQDGIAHITGMLVDGKSSIEQVMAGIAETIYIGFKAKNVVIGTRAKESDTVTGLAGYGEKALQIRSAMRIALADPSNDLAHVALNNGRDIFIDHPRDPKLAPHHSRWIMESHPTSFLLIPLLQQNRPLGIIFIDSPGIHWEGPIPLEVERQIRILRHTAVLALQNSA